MQRFAHSRHGHGSEGGYAPVHGQVPVQDQARASEEIDGGCMNQDYQRRLEEQTTTDSPHLLEVRVSGMLRIVEAWRAGHIDTAKMDSELFNRILDVEITMRAIRSATCGA
jgi:hypothetical protein